MSASSIPFKFPLLLIGILLLAVAGPTCARIQIPANESVPAVLVFGDSIVDTGNNNDLSSPAKCNFPPYGRDFQGGIPTGRFSNGKVPSDFLVEELGIKELLPAYKDPKLKPEDLLTGVCFAAGGVGYDDLSSQSASVPPLSEQLRQFKEYVNRVKAMIGEVEGRKLVSKSLVVILLSSNDIANTYFNSRIREIQYDFPTYADLLVKSATAFVMKCSEKYNKASELFNSKLSATLTTLNKNLGMDSRIVYLDVYNPLLDIINNYGSYGFEIANKGCCGTGKLEASVTCNMYSPFTCTDDTKYVFWDGYHPTEKTYKLLVNLVLAKYLDTLIM
ncbi:GDSL esterase/lipase At5g42170 [Linum perenne]